MGGGGTLDVYPPYGEMGHVTTPGAKGSWDQWQTEFPKLLRRSKEKPDDVALRIGGNVVNGLIYLAQQDESYQEVRLVGVLGGPEDTVSNLIRERLVNTGVTDRTVQVAGFKPSIGKVTRAARGVDRITYTRSGDSPNPYLTPERIRAGTAGAHVILASSLNNPELVQAAFDNVPREALLTYSPGNSEMRTTPGALREIMAGRNPHLLALNSEEMAFILGLNPETDPREIVERANQYARNVLCTLGTQGMLLRTADGQDTYGRAVPVPAHQIKDTLGAGDRATAVATHGLAHGYDPQTIVEEAARSTARLIQYVGANADIPDKRY